jgi:hypothetical protein
MKNAASWDAICPWSVVSCHGQLRLARMRNWSLGLENKWFGDHLISGTQGFAGGAGFALGWWKRPFRPREASAASGDLRSAKCGVGRPAHNGATSRAAMSSWNERCGG